MTALITALVRCAVAQVRVNWLTTSYYARCAKAGILPSAIPHTPSNNIVSFYRP